jgi:hypothetical protein
MGSFYTPTFPYDLCTALDNLPAYSLTDPLYQTLDQLREIIYSEKYFFQGMPFPTGDLVYVDGYGTVSGNVTVPPLSYLLAILGDSFYSEGDEIRLKLHRNLEGFTTRIYDKGAQLDVVVNSLYTENFTSVGLMANVPSPNVQTDRPIGPLFTQAPMAILIPGSLQVELTNLSPVPVFMQIFLHLAVPVNRQSTNEQLIGQGRNVSY